MLKTGQLPPDCDELKKPLVEPSSAPAHDGSRSCSIAGACWKELFVKKLVGLVGLLPLLELTDDPSPVIRRSARAVRGFIGSALAKRASSHDQSPPYCCHGKLCRK